MAAKGAHQHFDIASKELVERNPAAALKLVGARARGPVAVIDAQISALAAAVDKVIRVGESPDDYLVVIEFQSSHDSELWDTLVLRQAALVKRHKRPVDTDVVLQRPEADNLKRATGLHTQLNSSKRWRLKYRYEVVRMWKRRLAPILKGPLEMLPFSVLTDEARSRWDEVVRHIVERLGRAPRDDSNFLALATFLLMGLRQDAATAGAFRERMAAMKDSVSYQMVVEEGRDEAATLIRPLVVDLGRVKFGEPGAATLARIEQITGYQRLAALSRRISDQDCHSWDDLLRPVESES